MEFRVGHVVIPSSQLVIAVVTGRKGNKQPTENLRLILINTRGRGG